MGRIMAIDYGQRRTGLAVTDPGRIIATGLTTVDTPRLMRYLEEYCRREEVDCFVVGEPRQMDNTPSESAVYVEAFVAMLSARFPEKSVERIDERFTSKMAFQAMIDGGLGRKRRREKGLVDEISATIMLQDYMKVES